MGMGVLPAMCLCTQVHARWPEMPAEDTGFLKLELQEVVSHHVDAGKWTPGKSEHS